MRVPKGLTVTLDGMKDGQACFNVRVSKFYIFRTILRIVGQNIRNPIRSFLIVLLAFYWLMQRGNDATC